MEQQVADQKLGESHFMIVGLTPFGYVSNKTTFTAPGALGQVMRTNSLGDANHYELSQMMLFRQVNKFLIEFEPSLPDGELASLNTLLKTNYLVRH